jgi:hypothetical protein
MDHSLTAIRNWRGLCALVCVAAIATGATLTKAQSVSLRSQSQDQGAAVKEFAFIFRQTKVTLSLEQQSRRAEEVRDWALRMRNQGHKLTPQILAPESYLVSPDLAATSGRDVAKGDPVVALLLIDFSSLEEAKKAAESHPGLHYGVSIEVREATLPAFPPAQAPVAETAPR